VERVGSQLPLVVGDRLDTDIEAGHLSQIDSLLVLTGVTGVGELLAAPADRRPTYVAADLRGLLQPSSASLIRRDDRLTHGDRLAPLREACRRAWDAADSGQPSSVSASEIDRLRDDVAAALRS
jgi:hypothetical protein